MEERRARHSVCRAAPGGPDGGPRRSLGLKGIKRYLKLWTEVKRFSVSCEETGEPLGSLTGAPTQQVYVA